MSDVDLVTPIELSIPFRIERSVPKHRAVMRCCLCRSASQIDCTTGQMIWQNLWDSASWRAEWGMWKVECGPIEIRETSLFSVVDSKSAEKTAEAAAFAEVFEDFFAFSAFFAVKTSVLSIVK